MMDIANMYVACTPQVLQYTMSPEHFIVWYDQHC